MKNKCTPLAQELGLTDNERQLIDDEITGALDEKERYEQLISDKEALIQDVNNADSLSNKTKEMLANIIKVNYRTGTKRFV